MCNHLKCRNLDTHNETTKLVHYIPSGDILIHCGDFTHRSDWLGLEKGEVPPTIKNFDGFMASLPHKHKVVIAGNHECGLVHLSQDQIQALLPSSRYIFDQQIEIEGLTIYGTPWTDTAMMGFSEHRAERRKALWAKIPENLDILVSHAPPHGFGDRNNFGKNVGCPLLLARVLEVPPTVHLFGHIHEASGVFHNEKTTFINASNILSSSIYYFDI